MTKQLFLLILSVFVFLACANDDEMPPTGDDFDTSINRIMALGASRVAGDRPNFESFRYELWKDLIDGGWTFDFIGTIEDEATYPEYNDTTFDMDHEGRGGWTSGQILNGISDWLDQAGAPDIVLFSSPGGNDALIGLPYDDIVSNVNAIIDTIQAVNPNVIIIIEQLAPARSDLMTPELTTYFEQMQEDVITMANDQTTSTSMVISVDMFSGFSDSFLADDVHYNEAGAIYIAEQYYNTLVNVLER